MSKTEISDDGETKNLYTQRVTGGSGGIRNAIDGSTEAMEILLEKGSPHFHIEGKILDNDMTKTRNKRERYRPHTAQHFDIRGKTLDNDTKKTRFQTERYPLSSTLTPIVLTPRQNMNMHVKCSNYK